MEEIAIGGQIIYKIFPIFFLPIVLCVPNPFKICDNIVGVSKIVFKRKGGGVVDLVNSAKTNVKAAAGATWKDLNIWAIWANVSIGMGAADTISKDNNATAFDPGPTWPKIYGGGNNLGPIDQGAVPGLTYSYAIGKIEARATLTPAGIGDIIVKTKWDFMRTANVIGDNGGHYVNNVWMAGPSIQQNNRNDNSAASDKDLDPSSGNHLDKIYDNDAPACSMIQDPPIHNSETYVNFTQYVTVDLGGGPVQCSTNANGQWSYQAQLNLDKAGANKMDSNVLSTNFITLPANPKYAMK